MPERWCVEGPLLDRAQSSKAEEKGFFRCKLDELDLFYIEAFVWEVTFFLWLFTWSS
jgi:hypothetical protein